MATLSALTPAVREAAGRLLFTDYALVHGAACELEQAEDGFTLHVCRGDAAFERAGITFEGTDLDDLAALVAEGLEAVGHGEAA